MREIVTSAALAVACAAADPVRPDVLLIVSDDLNDWVGCLGGHPQVRTPHIDRLAARGTVFANAHCQAPLCNPSRISLMTGLRPTTTGVYALEPKHRDVPQLADRVTLPQLFKEAGYTTYTVGKVYHGGLVQTEREWSAVGRFTPLPKRPPERVGTVNVIWGPIADGDEATRDHQAATTAIAHLSALPATAPAFTGVGFSFPHVPLRVPTRWYELYPRDGLVLPEVRTDDRDDLPRFAGYLHWLLPEPRLGQLRDANQWEAHVQGYLAAISCMDAQVGRLLDALDRTGRAQRTIVVLFGDNGYHLGEKGITGKNTLWERSTRVPLVIAAPGLPPGRCAEPAELLDLYPTLAELAGLTPAPGQEGHSLVPQLRDAAAARPWPAITSHGPGNTSVRSREARLIRYADGSEEFYDLAADPHEYANRAADPAIAERKAELARWIPAAAPPHPASRSRLIDYRNGTATWEGTPIATDAPWPTVMP